MEEHPFGPVEAALLCAVGEACGEAESSCTDTQQASVRVVELLREAHESFNLFTTPPWFGLREAATELERRDLIGIDPGMAQLVPPGAPAPTADRLFLFTDEERLARAVAAVPQVGQPVVEKTRTRNASGETIPWVVVKIEVDRGNRVALTQGQASSMAAALAQALSRALAGTPSR